MVHVVLLAAPKGAGKTTACERFVDQARKAGLRVGGILASPRLDQDGRKVSIDAVDASTQEQRPLAVVEPEAQRRTVGQYRFEPQTMEWALERVMLALGAPIDLVVIDEIGPLELLQGEGFAPALERLPVAEAASAVLLVRSELLARLQDRLQALAPVTITLTLRNRDQAPARLLEEVWTPISRRWDAPDEPSKNANLMGL